MSQNDMSDESRDELLFADEEEVRSEGDRIPAPWKVLVVDDEHEVHQATSLVLSDYEFAGRKLEFLSAYTGAEAKKLIKHHGDTALVLLDVVMEDAQSGLEVARYIREDLGNRLVRIILRTGQPGQAPERQVITDYDINDYKQKTELTSTKLMTSVTTAIRSYRDLLTVDESRRGMNLLAMSVAHQIRNRTVAIAGFANLLLRSSNKGEGTHEYLSSIVEESGRLESVVGAVNLYSNCGPAEGVPLDLRPLVEEAFERFSKSLKHKKLDFDCTVNLDSSRGVADPKLLNMALDAIFDNLMDFVPGGEVFVTLAGSGSGILLEILDRGPGIAEEHLPYVFNPLFTTKADGVGMGLSLVRKVATEHGWDVVVVNRPRGGVRVGYTLPHMEEKGNG